MADEAFRLTEGLALRGMRKPRADALERRRNIVGNLIANLAALVLFHPPGSRIAVPAKNDGLTRYDRRDFPRQLVSGAIAALSSAGLVHRHEGVRNQARTTIEPSPMLRRKLLKLVRVADIHRQAAGETIIVRAAAAVRGGQKPLIDYPDTTESMRLRDEMAIINDAINGVRLTVGNVAPPPVRLTRRFQIPSPSSPLTFDQHGRIYDGFWINMHREDRHLIRINGEQLADLDFTGMFTQLAYLEVGLSVPEGDPYGGIEGLEADPDASPLDNARKRDAVKRGLNAFYFRTGRMIRLPPEVKALLGKDWNATRFAIAVRRRHAPIKHLFGTGIGIRLMFTESQILVHTLLDLAKRGIVALPVHDGIMVPASMRDTALYRMQEASKAIVGVALPVKAKLL